MAATVVENAFCVLELTKTNSVTLEQCHFRRRYGKPPPTRQSIYDWSKKCQETDCLCITTAVASVDEDMLRSVWTELDYRIDICRVTKDSQTQNICNFVTLTSKHAPQNRVSSILAKSIIISFQYNIESI